jgi:prepilin-type N-terminal cleavage/methylation domain-containing protein
MNFRRPQKLNPGWSARSRPPGFSLVELLVVIGVLGTASAIALAVLPGVSRAAAADGEMQRVMSALRRAHDVAVSERRNVAVEFVGVNAIRLVRQDVTDGEITGTTRLGVSILESGFTFQVFSSLPDTPDGFGTASATSFGSATSILFTTEGALVDQTGDPVNGTVFIGRGAEDSSARAVTVLGTTGLVTGYQWDGSQWTK